MKTERPLGTTQQSVLKALREHGSWTRGSAWLWDTVRGTERVLESLVRRGYVTKRDVQYHSVGQTWTTSYYEPVEQREET